MTDDFNAEPESSFGRATETIRSTTRHVSDVVDAARQPDMPLYFLAKLTRGAPLAALGTAFLIGFVVGRR